MPILTWPERVAAPRLMALGRRAMVKSQHADDFRPDLPHRRASPAERRQRTDPDWQPGRAGRPQRRRQIDARAAPARVARILAGLGLDAAMQERPLAELSGGWRMRVALAAVLFAEPDLLLLDEPTNHLDLEAALWLERFLRRYRHSFILVSHDRQLLNAATTTTLHLDNGKLALYSGGFDAFLRARREAAARQAALAQRQQRERERLQ